MDLLERDIGAGNRHPWELSRSDCILSVFDKLQRKYLEKSHLKIADIGAGDRYFDLLLQKKLENNNISAKMICIDANYTDDELVERGFTLGTDIAQIEDDTIDCCFMMDVMEHVEDDKGFLSAVMKKLKSGGILIVTVPAFQKLFSVHDEFLKHYRRYDIAMLNKLLPANSMEVAWYYFYTSLSVVRYVQIILKLLSLDNETGIAQWKYAEKHILTKLIRWCLNADFKMNMLLAKCGVHLPGLSLLAVMKKR